MTATITSIGSTKTNKLNDYAKHEAAPIDKKIIARSGDDTATKDL